ncbi:MAG: c-type cytochrome biogenesis protein CcsB, partial [Janthinobacterium lividum]
MELSQQKTSAAQTPYSQPPGYFKRLDAFDWLYAAVLMAAMLYALARPGAHMDYYEQVILVLAAPAFIWLGWKWKSVRWLLPLLGLLALSAVALYAGSIEMANKKFLLKYLLSSQSAILWMSTLFFLSTLFFWGGLLTRADFGGSVGSKLCWAAVVMGFTGMLVRWHESYLLGADIGHIPVSNLYEVFVLFAMVTALFYLYYEQHYKTRQLGPFVLLVIS